MSVTPKVVQSMESMTKQSFRDECDINEIVRRGRQGAVVAHVARGVPSYMDVSEVGDYKSALDMLRSTDAFFQGLPAVVRKAFDNDPAEFLDAMDTDSGRLKLEELGLVPKRPEHVPVRDAAGRFAVDEDGDGRADVNPARP